MEIFAEAGKVNGDFAEASGVVGEVGEVVEEIGEVVGGLAGDLTTGRSPVGEEKGIFPHRPHVRALGTREPNPGKE